MVKRPFAETSHHQQEIPLDAILSFLKDTRGTVNWSEKDLRNCLRLDAKQVQQCLALLEMQGYIAREGDQWLTTAAGETISQSKKPQFSAASVIKALDTPLSPWLGVGARLLTRNPWTIAFMGSILWLANCASLWYLHRLPAVKGKRSLGVSILVWTFVFIPLFSATAAATGLVTHR